VSQKTAIDLNTLGAPDNDSEGHGCYISEQGIQAAPNMLYGEPLIPGTGKYIGIMYICGKTYHIFKDRILNENMNIELAYFDRFDPGSLKYIPSEYISKPLVPDYFEYKIRNETIDDKRPVKTISYMTLTNKELKFYEIASSNTFSFKVRDNILAILNCNVIAFMPDDNNNDTLRFIKNPLFATSTQDDLTERFPLGIFALRSWTPAWARARPTYDPPAQFNAVPLSHPVNLYHEGTMVDGEFRILLSEETVFIYDRNTRKVKAIRQIRRRCRSDTKNGGETNYVKDQEGNINTEELSTIIYNKFFKQNGIDIVQAHLEYVNLLFLFTDKDIENIYDKNDWDSDGANGKTTYYDVPGWDKDNNVQHTILNSDLSFTGLDGFIGKRWEIDTEVFNEYTKLECVIVKPNHKYSIPYRFYHYLSSISSNNLDAGVAYLKTPMQIGFLEVNYLYVASPLAQCSWFSNKTDGIDYVMKHIFSLVDYDLAAMPDKWNNIGPDGNFKAGNVNLDEHEAFPTFLYSPWARVFEIYGRQGNAMLKGTAISYRKQDYLWGQRSRAFSIGTDIWADINPYTPENSSELLELDKWKVPFERIGLESKQLLVPVEDIKPAELAKRTLALRSTDKGIIIIPTLIEWEKRKLTTEYRNAVYFSDVGSFDINTTDQHYIVPSNISDSIIGLYGENRDILLISNKSIERFNIADASGEPLSFVRLEKVYDYLIDWSGINNRLDIITKEKGAAILNGIKRVSELFNTESRIAPDTIWKTTELRVIECESGNERFLYLLDSQNRAFRHAFDKPIFSLTSSKNVQPMLASEHGIYYCDWESGNPFTVEWSYRSERNILLSEISIRNAQYRPSDEKRWVRLWKDGELIRERHTSYASINFYKLGRGISSRLRIETSGYLREVAMTDTEEGQK